jgi:hypothetical protein
MAAIHDDKAAEVSLDEKDTRMGVAEPIPIDAAAEKRLIRKLDLILSPMMIIIFLVAYLDRSNIGKLTLSKQIFLTISNNSKETLPSPA